MTLIGMKFGMFLKFIDLIYIPKLVIIFSTYLFRGHFKNLNTLTFPIKMYRINTEYRYVLKVHRCALYIKISQHIAYRFSGTYISEYLKGLLARNNKN